jgi:hypothetical protein
VSTDTKTLLSRPPRARLSKIATVLAPKLKDSEIVTLPALTRRAELWRADKPPSNSTGGVDLALTSVTSHIYSTFHTLVKCVMKLRYCNSQFVAEQKRIHQHCQVFNQLSAVYIPLQNCIHALDCDHWWFVIIPVIISVVAALVIAQPPL